MQQGQFAFQGCDKIFLSSRGLSTHQRATHPKLRNQIKEEQASKKPKIPKMGKVFMTEEIDTML